MGGSHRGTAHQCCPPRRMWHGALDLLGRSPEQNEDIHSRSPVLQSAVQRDRQPPHPSLLMCVGYEALDVCLSLSKTVKPQFSLWAGILAVSKLIWRVGAVNPTYPNESQFLQACSRPGAESRPPIHLSDLGKRHEPASY